MKTVLNTSIEIETRNKLGEFCKENEVSMASVVEKALNEYLNKEN